MCMILDLVVQHWWFVQSHPLLWPKAGLAGVTVWSWGKMTYFGALICVSRVKFNAISCSLSTFSWIVWTPLAWRPCLGSSVFKVIWHIRCSSVLIICSQSPAWRSYIWLDLAAFSMWPSLWIDRWRRLTSLADTPPKLLFIISTYLHFFLDFFVKNHVQSIGLVCFKPFVGRCPHILGGVALMVSHGLPQLLVSDCLYLDELEGPHWVNHHDDCQKVGIIF